MKETVITLYPHLAASVSADYLSPEDQDLLARLASRNSGITEKWSDVTDLQRLFSPKVVELGNLEFEISPIGSGYSEKVRQQILENWRLAGASRKLLAIISAAQKQLIRRLVFEINGMIVEERQPAKIGKIGKKKLKNKDVQNLLLSLKHSHQYDWPIEQLANIIRPYAKKTRRKKAQ